MLVTLRRPANVDNDAALAAMFYVLNEVPPTCRSVPAHPCTLARLGAEPLADRIHILEPQGNPHFVALQAAPMRTDLTDPGGIREETTVLGVPCLTRRDNAERPITIS